MSKLLRFYGDTMFAIGSWFMKRGEKYATWITLDLTADDLATHCGCAECD